MAADFPFTVISAARGYLGRQEHDGPNDGPNVREWLAELGIHRPEPWCAAFACSMISWTARVMKQQLDFRSSAGALRLLEMNDGLRVVEPDAGCLVVWDHGKGKGHVGIITGVTRVAGVLASIAVIAGNTNDEGSRDADSVVERGFPFPQARTVAGYLAIR